VSRLSRLAAGLRQMSGNLRFRVTVLVLVAVLAGTTIGSVLAYSFERRDVTKQVKDDLSVQLADDAKAADPAISQLSTSTSRSRVDAAASVVGKRTDAYAVFDRYAPGLVRCKALCPAHLPAQILSAKPAVFAYAWVVANGRHFLAASHTLSIHRDVVLVEYYDFTIPRSQLSRLRHELTVLVEIGVLVAAAMGLIGASGVTGPIRRTAHAAASLSAGRLDVRIRRKGTGEVAALASEFNAMADRLSDALRESRAAHIQQQQFVADVSHELRTPLAAMLAAADELSSTHPDRRARAEALLTTQIRRINRLVSDLLEISRFDAGQASLETEWCDLERLTLDVVQTVAPEADVHVVATGDVEASVDPRRVHTILRNILSNALQHGAPPIDITVDGTGEQVVISVADDGPGVPRDLINSIFDRFVRADTSRATRHANTGLGLAIAAHNAALHHSNIVVSESGRSTFTLAFRRHPDEAVTENTDPPPPR
jgi:two-component system sensor histidine kinase MtrB